MSRACDVIFLGAATSFPNAGQPGNVLIGQAGAIDGAVAIVADDGSPIVIEATPYVPPNDNFTDLGTAAARFRSIYLGTSAIIGAAATGRALIIHSPADNQGDLIPGEAAAGLRIVGAAGDPNGARLTTAAAGGGAVVLEAYGTDADVALTVRQKGTDGLVLGTTTGTMAFYGGTARAKPTGATALPAFTDPPSAAEMANLRTQFNAIVTALSTTAGVSLCTG